MTDQTLYPLGPHHGPGASGVHSSITCEDEGRRLAIHGKLDVYALAGPDRDLLRPERWREPMPAQIDLSDLSDLDTIGALALIRLRDALEGVAFVGARRSHRELLEQVGSANAAPPLEVVPHLGFAGRVRAIGHTTVGLGHTFGQLVTFFGHLVTSLYRLAKHPGRIRFRSIVHHMEETGFNALAIVGLLAYLIGVVLAYQGAEQLKRFGAEVFVVNLLGISILRELGVLITAIIVAGRSGSAFAAQIGTMKVNQEVDALETIGMDPVEVLVVPRTLALIMVLPLLVFYSNMIAIAGGATMSYFTLDISLAQFVAQFKAEVKINNFWVGMVKAPVFAFIIAMVGCFQGLETSGSAESVGKRTTSAVVQSIFIVIALDAVFSILFSLLRV